jgi:hypothetical protein
VETPIPYLLVWKDERHGGEIKEAVSLARYVDPHDSSASALDRYGSGAFLWRQP